MHGIEIGIIPLFACSSPRVCLRNENGSGFTKPTVAHGKGVLAQLTSGLFAGPISPTASLLTGLRVGFTFEELYWNLARFVCT